MILEYQAVDRSGKAVRDSIDASDITAATGVLRDQGLYVTQIVPQSGTRKRTSAAVSEVDTYGARLPIRQLTTFTRQVAMLLSAGSAVVPAIQSLTRQFSKPAHVRMLERIIADLEEGEGLACALRKHPKTFDSAYCAIVAAGEASAALPEMFAQLAKVVGKRRVMRNKILGTLAYPALLSTLSIHIVGVLLFFVMPRFGAMFDTIGVEVPASTAFLLALGTQVQAWWYIIVPVLGAVVTGIVMALRSAGGRQWIADTGPKIPMVGRLISSLIQGETFRVLGMLIEARVGVLEAIDLVRGVTTNRRFQDLYDRIESEVSSGGSVSRAMESSGLISPAICHALHTGEESGQLGAAATYVANILDEDNTELIESVTKLVEPAILIVMGVVVGFVAVSLFMPMFDMTSAIH